MIQARWDLKLDRFRSRMGETVRNKAQRITQHLVDEFIERSPVLRGHFRASWSVSEGQPNLYRASGGSPEAPLAAPRIQVLATTLFPHFFIANGQPYAQEIEHGSSKKAPYGVVRVTIAGMK